MKALENVPDTDIDLVLRVLNGEMTGYEASPHFGLPPSNFGRKAWSILRYAVDKGKIIFKRN